MKTTFRLLALLLVSLMMLSVLVGCKKNENPADTTAPAAEAPSETEPVDLMADVPTGNYNGYEFHIAVTPHVWATYSMTGDIGTPNFSKPVYERTEAVKEKLNIKIKQTEIGGGALTTEIRSQIAASSTDNYDAVWHAMSRSTVLIQEGCYYELSQGTQINLSKPWWYESFNEDIHLGNKRYMLMGALNTIYQSSFRVCAFNKDTFKTIAPDVDLYEVYNSGNWTYETMFNYMKLAAREGDGDGIRDTRNDYFGLGMHNNMFPCLLSASGYTITTKDENGYPMFEGLSENYIRAWQYIASNIADPTYSTIPGITPGYSEYKGDYHAVFNEGRNLFLFQACGHMNQSQEAGLNYGLIGFPKLDVEGEYHSPLYYGASAMSVLATNSDIERTTVVLENLCAYSYGTVDTAFIENILYYKYAKDAASVTTLQNVLSTGTIDIAYIYDTWGKINGKTINSGIIDALKARNMNVASLFEQTANDLRNNINKTKVFYERG